MGLIYLPDTNACIGHLTGRQPQISARLKREPAGNVALCSIVLSELFYGAFHSARVAQNLATLHDFAKSFVSLPFDDQSAQIHGEIRALLSSKGTPIGPYDLQIAAIALANDLILVTHNTREFERVPNLKIEDWE